MSHDATAWARKQQTGNTPAKFLLLMLADAAGSDYSCWPGQETLSKLTEMSDRTIRRATTLLVECGLIRVFYRYRADNTRRSCRYQLLIDGPETELPETVDWRSMKQMTVDDEADTVSGGPPDTQSTATGQAVQIHRPESPVIPSTEPSVKEPSAMNPGASRPKQATRIPEDFLPDEKMRAWFVGEKLGALIDGQREHERFMDYWRAKPGAMAKKHDWPATWRNWMRTAADRVTYRPTSGAPQQYKSTTDGKVMQTLTLAEKFRQMEENQ